MINLKDIKTGYTEKAFIACSPVQIHLTKKTYNTHERQREMISEVKISAVMNVRSNISGVEEEKAKGYLARQVHSHMYGELVSKLSLVKHTLDFGGDPRLSVVALEEIINDLTEGK